MKVLVSAGPTREAIDDVRFLSNRSSGKTGYAIAEAARDAGHEVVLVSGPVALSPPKGLNTVAVESAVEMLAALEAEFETADVLIMSAAVADYRPARRSDGKIKKSEGPWSLELVRNPDILATLGRDKGSRILIGFALETERAVEHARGKLERKNLDLIVVNAPENFGRSRSAFRFLSPSGLEAATDVDKAELGRRLVERAETLWATRRKK